MVILRMSDFPTLSANLIGITRVSGNTRPFSQKTTFGLFVTDSSLSATNRIGNIESFCLSSTFW